MPAILMALPCPAILSLTNAGWNVHSYKMAQWGCYIPYCTACYMALQGILHDLLHGLKHDLPPVEWLTTCYCVLHGLPWLITWPNTWLTARPHKASAVGILSAQHVKHRMATSAIACMIMLRACTSARQHNLSCCCSVLALLANPRQCSRAVMAARLAKQAAVSQYSTA